MTTEKLIPELIFDFLADLPKTIQADTLFWIPLYGSKTNMKDASTREDILKLTKDYLTEQRSEIETFAASLISIAILDHRLEANVADASKNEVMIRAAADALPKAQGVLAGLPLRRRHFEKALTDWRTIRSTSITAKDIRDFETLCLRP
jgi:hypothetical protein